MRMNNKRTYYTGLVIIITALTLGIMLDMRIMDTAPDVYDKLDTDTKYGQNQQIEYVVEDENENITVENELTDEAEDSLLEFGGKKKLTKWK